MFFRTQTGAWRSRRWLKGSLAVLFCAATLTSLGHAASQPAPKPYARVPLHDLGFPGYPVSLLHQGASMATVHMLDNTHALFTYSMRALVPRLPGDDANDSDRQVAAVLVEVPSGKVLARTKWHLHDHGRYLWSVGPGLFVVRIGRDLSLLAPLRGLAAGLEPFQRYALPHRPGQPVMIAGSPDGKVLTVEIESEGEAILGDTDTSGTHRKHYTLEFYRLHVDEQEHTPVKLEVAGAVGSPVALRLAMDGDGYLWAEDGQRGRWMVSFNEFGGKQEKLAPVLSSCHPRLNLLSRSQFLVESCRGSELQPMLAAYGFDGHENWQEPFGEALQPPTLAIAPVAGRFALSRLYASASSEASPVASDPIAQEIRVYQTESGDLLLHLLCSPAVRSSENFDLSPDGRVLAVLAPETLDLYQLPDLSAKDRKELTEAQTMTPPLGNGPVTLASISRPIVPPETAGIEPGTAAAGQPQPPAAQPAPARAAMADPVQAPAPAATRRSEAVAASIEGEGSPESRRTPPTLLKPGEKAEFKARIAGPK